MPTHVRPYIGLAFRHKGTKSILFLGQKRRRQMQSLKGVFFNDKNTGLIGSATPICQCRHEILMV
jgi:hypothetical protein